jgi:hypothetical protein
MLIVLADGALPAFAWLALAAPWIAAGAALAGRPLPASSATLLALASLALGVATVVGGGLDMSVVAAAEALLGILCARLLVRRTPAHDLQAALLSVLLVLAGSALNFTLSYPLLFVSFSITVVWALSTRQLLAGVRALGQDVDGARARRDVVTPAFFAATGSVSLAVLVIAALVFAAFPRVGFGDLGALVRKESRLPTAVGLRGDPRAGGGTEVVARVRGVPRAAFDDGLYLRGAVYDVIAVDGFKQSERPRGDRRRALTLVDPLEARYEVTLMPLVGDTVLTLGSVTSVRPLGGGNANPSFPLTLRGRNAHDEIKASGPLLSPFRYEVYGAISSPGFISDEAPAADRIDPPDGDRYLTVPADLAATLAAVAADVVKDDDGPRERAAALRELLLTRFRYSQDPPRFASAPLVTFLRSAREGHCEYFASAFALLLRHAGIAARVVGGFQGGAWDDGVVVFHTRHAHAWVEWYLPGHGWIVDDATPLRGATRDELTGFGSVIERVRRFWDDTVIDYSYQDQSEALTNLRQRLDGRSVVRALLPLGAVLIVVGVGLLLRRRRGGRRARIHPLAKAIVDAVARDTRAPVPPSWTLREAVERVGGDALREALALYELERFGGRPAPPARVRAAVRALRKPRV